MTTAAGADRWEDTARGARQALAALGHEFPDCMPGSGEPCGAGFEDHALTYLAILSAFAAHCICHMGRTADYAQEAYLALKRFREGCDQHRRRAQPGLN